MRATGHEMGVNLFPQQPLPIELQVELSQPQAAAELAHVTLQQLQADKKVT